MVDSSKNKQANPQMCGRKRLMRKIYVPASTIVAGSSSTMTDTVKPDSSKNKEVNGFRKIPILLL